MRVSLADDFHCLVPSARIFPPAIAAQHACQRCVMLFRYLADQSPDGHPRGRGRVTGILRAPIVYHG